MLDRQMNDILQTKQPQQKQSTSHDRWLNYRQLLAKRAQQDPATDKSDERAVGEISNEKLTKMINRSMNRLLHGVKSKDKWLNYRQLLLDQGLQKRNKNIQKKQKTI